MRTAYLFPLIFFVVCSRVSLAQGHNDSAEGESCISASKEIEAIVQRDQQADGFSLQMASVPSLEEGLASLQVSASTAQAPAVRQMKFCEITPSMFHIRDGHVVGTTVIVDREYPRWLIGLAPDGKKFLLAGFPDPLKGFNGLIEAVGLQISNPDVAAEFFDLYLRLTGREALRESVIVDEMQLQSVGLEDFRLRYSLPKARTMYAKWWGGIGPAIKNHLRRPEVTPVQNGFKVTYLRYAQSRVLHESVAISKDGIVTVGGSKTLYAPVMSASPGANTVDLKSSTLRK